MPRRPLFLVTCEHGGNRVPRPYAGLFAEANGILTTHRGWDPGALRVASRLARKLSAPLVASTTTRLLVDLNRSPRHPTLLSVYTRPLPAAERRALLERHYHPYREAVARRVLSAARRGVRTIHVSVHSFTPVRNGIRRPIDLGLLYDPRRPSERRACGTWKEALERRLPDLLIRRNAPYRGDADGITSALRRELPPGLYVGVEIEINQRHIRRETAAGRRIVAALLETAGTALGESPRRQAGRIS